MKRIAFSAMQSASGCRPWKTETSPGGSGKRLVIDRRVGFDRVRQRVDAAVGGHLAAGN